MPDVLHQATAATGAETSSGRLRCEGTFTIRQGTNPLARLLVRVAGLPRAGNNLPTTLHIVPVSGGEQWRRRFGESILNTTQRTLPNGWISERVLCLELQYRVDRTPQSVRHEQMKAALRCGPVRVPLPRWLAPQVIGGETATGVPNQIRVLVEVRLPLIGVLLAYDGVVEMLETWP